MTYDAGRPGAALRAAQRGHEAIAVLDRTPMEAALQRGHEAIVALDRIRRALRLPEDTDAHDVAHAVANLVERAR